MANPYLEHIDGILCPSNSSCRARSLFRLSNELLWLVLLLNLQEGGQAKGLTHLPAVQR